MTTLFHRGAPCHPPTVNGVTFEPHSEHEGFFHADVPEDKLTLFESIPHFVTDPALAPEPEPEVEALSLVPPPAADPKAQIEEIKAALVSCQGELQAALGANIDLQAQVDTLTVENEELRTRLAELDSDEDKQDADAAANDLAQEIADLEAKKAEGIASKAEIMKLGKLKKKAEANNSK